MLNTTIVLCQNCRPHPFQDKRYGQKRRVANRIKQTTAQLRYYRCTVCGESVDTGKEEPIVADPPAVEKK